MSFIISICYLTHNQEIISEPYGPFNDHISARAFAIKKIKEIKQELKTEYDCKIEDIEDLYEFDFTIKKIN